MKTPTGEQRKIIELTLHEFRQGRLHSGSRKKVRNPRQAIAIGLKEAGASKYESAAENKRNLSRTRHKIQSGEKR